VLSTTQLSQRYPIVRVVTSLLSESMLTIKRYPGIGFSIINSIYLGRTESKMSPVGTLAPIYTPLMPLQETTSSTNYKHLIDTETLFLQHLAMSIYLNGPHSQLQYFHKTSPHRTPTYLPTSNNHNKFF
jgi:hypothetical protein